MLNFIRNWSWGGHSVKNAPDKVPQNSTVHTKLESKVNDHVTSLMDSFVMVPHEDLPKSTGFLTKKFYDQVHDSSKYKPSDASGACSVMQEVGGTSMSLKTTEGHMIKAMHFNLDNVMAKMQESGAKKAVFSTNLGNISSFVLDKSVDAQKKCYENLVNFGFSNPGIWDFVEIDNKVYIFSKENFEKFEQAKCTTINKNKRYLLPSVKESLEPIVINKTNRKTVVLHGGLYSRLNTFSMATEAAKYLSLGFNVLVSEDKHDQLDNAEAHKNVMANRAALYQELKSRKVANEDIIWAGTCFSTGAAVECAAKYPGSHVIVNQGYNDIKDVVKSMAPSMLGCFVNKACKNFDFDYKVGSFLKDLKGNLIVIGNMNDSSIYLSQYDQIRAAAEKERNLDGKRQFVEIKDEAVTHAGHWFKSPAARVAFENHLKEFNLSQGDILV